MMAKGKECLAYAKDGTCMKAIVSISCYPQCEGIETQEEEARNTPAAGLWEDGEPPRNVDVICQFDDGWVRIGGGPLVDGNGIVHKAVRFARLDFTGAGKEK